MVNYKIRGIMNRASCPRISVCGSGCVLRSINRPPLETINTIVPVFFGGRSIVDSRTNMVCDRDAGNWGNQGVWGAAKLKPWTSFAAADIRTQVTTPWDLLENGLDWIQRKTDEHAMCDAHAAYSPQPVHQVRTSIES